MNDEMKNNYIQNSYKNEINNNDEEPNFEKLIEAEPGVLKV